tara:strand:- start:25205 stop:25951 length:747 start_codon:yes stop_codon:yes gene_type:complete
MAVNVDTVYQRILMIANKEQRGYITPQEFNLMANQAQMDIFEQYFYDLNQFNRTPDNNTEYSNMTSILKEKISIFEDTFEATTKSGNAITLPNDVYRLGQVLYGTSASNYNVVEPIDNNRLVSILRSKLTYPSAKRPIYVRNGDSIGDHGSLRLRIYPSTLTSSIKINYIKQPATVVWGYSLVPNSDAVDGYTALYNQSTSTNFSIHSSEETELVIKILQLAGIVLEDPSLYQMASGEDQKSIQQEKI